MWLHEGPGDEFAGNLKHILKMIVKLSSMHWVQHAAGGLQANARSLAVESAFAFHVGVQQM
jgi:hypothetical protein